MITPPYLQQGDKVAIVATARKISQKEIDPAIATLQSWGLHVIMGPHLFSEDNQFAGTDQERISDLQWALDNEEISAIICARGGYGTARIIDHIDFSNFVSNPKWIVGFSDPTVLHLKLSSLGIKSIHGSMPILFGKEGYDQHIYTINDSLFGKQKSLGAPAHDLNVKGSSQGHLVGGNLTLIHCSLGTQWEGPWENCILFFEDLDEYLYHIDRVILHLEQYGLFQKINGLAIGHLSDMNDNAIPFGKSAEEIVSGRLKNYDFPIAFGFPFGHLEHNEAVICGAHVKFHVSEEGSTLNLLPRVVSLDRIMI